MTCTLSCELFIALIAQEIYSALCFLVLFKKLLNLIFSSFFVPIVFECRFYSFSNFCDICGVSGFIIVVLVV